MTDKNPLAHYSGVLSQAVQESAAADVKAAQSIAPEFNLKTSAGGRGYVSWYFSNVMQRHDFGNYITKTLAADFACALSSWLRDGKPRAESWAAPAAVAAAAAVPDERMAFEAWASKAGYSVERWKNDYLLYADQKTDIAWEIWQARAALAATPAAAAPVVLPEWEKVRRGLTMVMLGLAGRPDCSESAIEAALDAVTEPGMPLAGLRMLSGVSAPAAQPARKYICPVRTIADLVNNLMLMDQALPIYGAQYIEHPAGKRRAIAVPPTVSIERVKDSRWIGEGEALNTAIIWTRAEQPAAQAVAMPFEPRPTTDAFLPWWEPYELSEHWFVELHKIARDAWNAALSSPQAQADARDAQLLAFAVSEIRRDEMTDSELLDAMEQKRIAVVPEYEGPWDAEIYNDEGKPNHCGSGSTPREAIRAAIAAQAAQQGDDKQ